MLPGRRPSQLAPKSFSLRFVRLLLVRLPEEKERLKCRLFLGSKTGVCGGIDLSCCSSQLHLRGIPRFFRRRHLSSTACEFDVIFFLQNVYLLGTSLARPVIARGMIEVAAKEGCECVVLII